MFGSSLRPKTKGLIAKDKRNSELRKPRLAAFVALTTSGMLAGIVILAGYTQVPQVTRATGALVPTGSYQQIETLEGGIVRAVHVSDGQAVEAGDILIQLDNPDLTREFQTLSNSVFYLEKKGRNSKAIIDALAQGAAFSNADVIALRDQGLTEAAAQLGTYFSSQNAQGTSIDQQRQILVVMADALEIAQGRVQKQQASYQRFVGLRDRGLKSVTQLQQEEDAVDELRGEAAEALVRLSQAEKSLGDAIAALENESQTLFTDTVRQLAVDEAELVAQTQALKSVSARYDRLRLYAPARGTVQAVAFANEGEVIAPGETLFELLPAKKMLQAEVRIKSLDIGHVSPNQVVALTVDTFDARRFGKVEGEVVAFSPVPLLDEHTGQPYFRASIELATPTIGSGAFNRPLQAGMTVVAEMTTGEQTLLGYLMKPVQHSLNYAFRER